MIRLIDERIMEKLRDKPENIDLEEFVPLVVEWREEKALMAKCPYCVMPIEKQATKCNHCLSELEWFKFDGLYGPCKAGASEEMEAALVMARATIQAEKARRETQAKDRLRDYLTRLSKSKCISCKEPVFTSDELQYIAERNIVVFGSLAAAKELDHNRRDSGKTHKCLACSQKSKNLGCLMLSIGIVLILLLFIIDLNKPQ